MPQHRVPPGRSLSCLQPLAQALIPLDRKPRISPHGHRKGTALHLLATLVDLSWVRGLPQNQLKLTVGYHYWPY